MNFLALTEKKEQLDARRPLPNSLVRNLDEWFRIELTYTSNAIEGNTLTRRETALVVEKGLTVGGKSLIEHLEATNHAKAIDWLQDQITRKPQELGEKDILELHAMILRGIDDTNAGRYRNIAVRISGSSVVLPNPMKVPDLMADFAQWLRQPEDLHPVEFAAEAHYRLVTIHPFVDGNGRTARLLMNLILLMSGYPIAIIQKRERLKYISSLETAQLGGSKRDYMRIVTRAVERSLNIYLKALDGESSTDIDDTRLLKIGELAKRAGVANSTIRHWTKESLIQVAEKTESGYQLFDADTLEQIKKIRSLQERRYTLEEIRAMLEEEA